MNEVTSLVSKNIVSPNPPKPIGQVIHFKADNDSRYSKTQYPAVIDYNQAQVDKFQKQQKKQGLKNTLLTGVSVASGLAIIALVLMQFKAMRGGSMDSLRSKTEQEAVKIKSIDLSKIKERAKDTYSKEVQDFINELRGLLKRSDIEEKGGKRVAQVQLAGPGGTGKTDVAGVIAKKINELYPGSEYYIPDLSMLSSSSWKGQDEQMLTEYTNAIIKRAQELAAEGSKNGKKKYLVCFLDEFDKIAMVDNGINKHSSNKTTGALKTLINGLMAQDNVILLSATNYPELIEDAVGSRMAKKVVVDYLNPKQIITAIVEHYKKSAKPERISADLLDISNEKLNEICKILGSRKNEMEYRKLFNNIMPTTHIKSPEDGKIELKHLVEAITDVNIAKTLNLTAEETARLKTIVGLS